VPVVREDAPLHEHPRLLHIPFSSTGRLTRNVHLFTYRGVEFKLIQNPLRGQESNFAHNLLAIVGDDAEKQAAYSAAHEFLSGLAWENSCAAYLGLPSWRRPPRTTLRDAKPSIWGFPPIPQRGVTTGYNISILPCIETEQQRLALALCMEAGASSNEYLKFLFYWQVLSIGADPIGAANNMLRRLRKDPARLHARLIEAAAKLSLRGKSIGNYFADDCRDAIGHIARKPGKTRLVFDSEEDRRRIAESADVVQLFAEHYIEHNLQLNKKVALFQLKPGEFPRYLPRESPAGKYVRPAQPKLFAARRTLGHGPSR
jgi:hypothetical protein